MGGHDARHRVAREGVRGIRELCAWMGIQRSVERKPMALCGTIFRVRPDCTRREGLPRS